MKIEEFENNTQEAIDKIEITTEYIPYIEKVAQCKSIARTTSHKEVNGKEIFVIDSPTRHLFYTMKLVELYTNIEFEDTELVKAYDILGKNLVLPEIFAKIPAIELEEWKSIMEMTLDDMFENEHSTVSVIDSLKDSLAMIVGAMIEGIEKAAEENNEVQIELGEVEDEENI